MKIILPLFLIIAIISTKGEDWTTSDGTTYKDVTVVKIEASSVTIQDVDGSATINLSKLPQDIQQRLATQAATHPESQQVQISGQVFIVTRGGQNFKLGDVHVQVYKFADLDPILTKRETDAAPQVQKLWPLIKKLSGLIVTIDNGADHALGTPDWQSREAIREKSDKQFKEIKDRYYYLISGDYYLADLPSPLADAPTDADGKFSTTVPGVGSYIITAKATRDVIDDQEQYWWIVRVDLNDPKGKYVQLTNENMTSSNSPNSLIKTGQ
jgi:hypothetical protein